MKVPTQILFIFLSSIFLVITLSGCDQAHEKLAAILKKSPEESLASVSAKLAQGKFKAAAEEGEPMALQEGPLQGKFSFAVAQAYAQLGSVDETVRFVKIAIDRLDKNLDRAIFVNALFVDPSFENVRTDIRFLSIVQGEDTLDTTVAVDVGRKMNGAGIEVEAGDVKIKLP
ncbi:MAG: hypothetical protein JW384_00961 [Nitrosomonadaceae bacterium]|nr:hypothetical protein [Nitrosomonadaceae bacterium]